MALSSAPLRLVLLPGLGADEALFIPQRPAFPQLEVPSWLAPRPGETLASFAARMAEVVGPAPGLVLGGISFGGMVALEMARHLRPRAVVLIASCGQPRAAIPAYLRTLARLATHLPAGTLVPPRAARGLITWALGAHTPQAQALLDHFLQARPPTFVRWGLGALLGWRAEPTLPCPVFHIHGAADHLILARRVAATEVVAGAGHLVNITHAAAVNAFLVRAVGGGRARGQEAPAQC